jgi:hypothetical protein
MIIISLGTWNELENLLPKKEIIIIIIGGGAAAGQAAGTERQATTRQSGAEWGISICTPLTSYKVAPFISIYTSPAYTPTSSSFDSLSQCVFYRVKEEETLHTHTHVYMLILHQLYQEPCAGPASLAPGPPPILSSCRESPGPVNNYRVPHTIIPLYRLYCPFRWRKPHKISATSFVGIVRIVRCAHCKRQRTTSGSFSSTRSAIFDASTDQSIS